MKKKFVVLIDQTTAAQNKAFLERIKEEDLSWWHWIQDAWLLVDSTGEWTSSKIVEVANEYYPTINKVVLEFREDGTDTWTTFGPKTPQRDMATWIKSTWT